MVWAKNAEALMNRSETQGATAQNKNQAQHVRKQANCDMKKKYHDIVRALERTHYRLHN